jgi:hypothetical protein
MIVELASFHKGPRQARWRGYVLILLTGFAYGAIRMTLSEAGDWQVGLECAVVIVVLSFLVPLWEHVDVASTSIWRGAPDTTPYSRSYLLEGRYASLGVSTPGAFVLVGGSAMLVLVAAFAIPTMLHVLDDTVDDPSPVARKNIEWVSPDRRDPTKKTPPPEKPPAMTHVNPQDQLPPPVDSPDADSRRSTPAEVKYAFKEDSGYPQQLPLVLPIFHGQIAFSRDANFETVGLLYSIDESGRFRPDPQMAAEVRIDRHRFWWIELRQAERWVFVQQLRSQFNIPPSMNKVAAIFPDSYFYRFQAALEKAAQERKLSGKVVITVAWAEDQPLGFRVLGSRSQ